jgi:hypothetical protein
MYVMPQPIGYVPYSHALSSDYREQLVDVSLQLLLILLDFRYIDPSAAANTNGGDGSTAAAIAAPTSLSSVAATTPSATTPAAAPVAAPRLDNIFVALVANLHQKSDLKALYDGTALHHDISISSN